LCRGKKLLKRLGAIVAVALWYQFRLRVIMLDLQRFSSG
jgi:hypothetical protein